MPYIPPSVVREVKRMDLLTYLKNYEPYELVHFSGNTYTTRMQILLERYAYSEISGTFILI